MEKLEAGARKLTLTTLLVSFIFGLSNNTGPGMLAFAFTHCGCVSRGEEGKGGKKLEASVYEAQTGLVFTWQGNV